MELLELIGSWTYLITDRFGADKLLFNGALGSSSVLMTLGCVRVIVFTLNGLGGGDFGFVSGGTGLLGILIIIGTYCVIRLESMRVGRVFWGEVGAEFGRFINFGGIFMMGLLSGVGVSEELGDEGKDLNRLGGGSSGTVRSSSSDVALLSVVLTMSSLYCLKSCCFRSKLHTVPLSLCLASFFSFPFLVSLLLVG